MGTKVKPAMQLKKNAIIFDHTEPEIMAATAAGTGTAAFRAKPWLAFEADGGRQLMLKATITPNTTVRSHASLRLRTTDQTLTRDASLTPLCSVRVLAPALARQRS